VDRSRNPALAAVRVCRLSGSGVAVQPDELAVEEPLEIRLGCDGRRAARPTGPSRSPWRTPGHDLELAAGFLFTEGILTDPEQIAGLRSCGGGNGRPRRSAAGPSPWTWPGWSGTSTRRRAAACVARRPSRPCASVPQPCSPSGGRSSMPRSSSGCPRCCGRPRRSSNRTGGLHAPRRCSTRTGSCWGLREDVGRHNAPGQADRCPVPRRPHAAVGGPCCWSAARVSFELVQKAAVAGIPILAAVGRAVEPGR